jgi:hypothetical protein
MQLRRELSGASIDGCALQGARRGEPNNPRLAILHTAKA